uniref:Uncharacterized protein n=1 Tax=Physcomitrium patens TaxID=3218 RepID=A0A2K1KC86_PHYPA|nr:hypothetical protein PHYPA_010565 [Physcomitrium patens]
MWTISVRASVPSSEVAKDVNASSRPIAASNPRVLSFSLIEKIDSAVPLTKLT